MSKIPLAFIVVLPFAINEPEVLLDCNLPWLTITFPVTFKVPVVNALKIPVPPIAPAVMFRSPLTTAVVVEVKKLIVPVANGQL